MCRLQLPMPHKKPYFAQMLGNFLSQMVSLRVVRPQAFFFVTRVCEIDLINIMARLEVKRKVLAHKTFHIEFIE